MSMIVSSRLDFAKAKRADLVLAHCLAVTPSPDRDLTSVPTLVLPLCSLAPEEEMSPGFVCVKLSLFRMQRLQKPASVIAPKVSPVFLEPVPNVTVAEGRDASLSCTVDNLGQHRVAWIHLDRQMIVSIHNHVITRLSHFTVTHDSHKTWTLHVTSVTVQDRGHYMCQVNTVPMMSQTGYLQVVVPPNIDDKQSSKSNIVVREKDNVTLRCTGHGFPMPQIKWRREDSNLIETSDGKKVQQLDGPELPLHQVSRTHMGAYLCIASNGVPPSVSKRITLDVEFAPQMHVPNQLVGTPKGTDVRLECFVEAHPKAITYWEFSDAMVMNTSRITTQTLENHYKIHMILDIRDLDDGDFGMYKCISKNSIAETDGSITLNMTPRPTTPPQMKQSRPDSYDADGDIHYRSRGRPGRKEHYNRQDPQHGRRRPQDLEGIKEEREEEERREMEENRRKTQELERRRLEHDYNRGHLNEQATRVTHTPASRGVDVSPYNRLLSATVLAAFMLALFPQH
ncbi:lachesin-like [Penaeus japonicus]|uniref:lachesin-like n=1 Tax=Penaeus japonicus TaxID=27405 RepID=UPI001C715957|nr:lachesin-like [Penaeus japonicus]